MHKRLQPKRNQFQHGMFMMYLDLDEIDELSCRVAGFRKNAFHFYAFHDADHFPFNGLNTKQAILQYLAEQGVCIPPEGRVRLLTLPRVLGYIFNPVSFYFCFDGSGAPVCAVAEVGNTFGEMKLYVLREFSPDRVFRMRVPKHFYVSPFSDLEVEFDFQLSVPNAGLDLRINDVAGGEQLLLSRLTGKRLKLCASNLVGLTLKYPLVTLRVIFLIHVHALRLWLKRVRFFRKGEAVHFQRGVLRPHRSIAKKTS